jgi:hypothetical protein|tara:strand:+ start:1197 stop:1670 length:474 start_codon:yes stop_codon:yes gene_type:complete
MPVITGTAYWAAITNPNTTFDSDGIWSIDVANLDKKNLEMVKKDGLVIKNKGDDREDFVTVKRRVRRKDGSLNRAPDLVDGQKRTMTNTLIGNGSKVNVHYTTYEWEFKGRAGVSADLRAVQVVDLIPYNTEADEAFDVVDGGFVSGEGDEDIPFAS